MSLHPHRPGYPPPIWVEATEIVKSPSDTTGWRTDGDLDPGVLWVVLIVVALGSFLIWLARKNADL